MPSVLDEADRANEQLRWRVFDETPGAGGDVLGRLVALMRSCLATDPANRPTLATAQHTFEHMLMS